VYLDLLVLRVSPVSPVSLVNLVLQVAVGRLEVQVQLERKVSQVLAARLALAV